MAKCINKRASKEGKVTYRLAKRRADEAWRFFKNNGYIYSKKQMTCIRVYWKRMLNKKNRKKDIWKEARSIGRWIIREALMRRYLEARKADYIMYKWFKEFNDEDKALLLDVVDILKSGGEVEGYTLIHSEQKALNNNTVVPIGVLKGGKVLCVRKETACN